MEIIGYILTFLVGLTLGIMGSGGSILIIPTLIYLFKIEAIQATTYSLFLIGITALSGSYTKIKSKLVDFKLVIWFGFPSLFSMFITRTFLISYLPINISIPYIGNLPQQLYLISAFAFIMFLAGYSMITNKQEECIECGKKLQENKPLLIVQGLIIGLISGIFGAGGGFLIIPGLVIFGKTPMKSAVSTSLFLVAINSIMGFFSSIHQLQSLNFNLLFMLTLLSILGIILGNKISKRIQSEQLKPYFGYFILFISIFILIKEYA